MTERFVVMNGPDRLEIANSLLDSTPEDKRAVAFRIEGHYGQSRGNISVLLDNIRRQSLTDGSWSFTGVLMPEGLRRVHGFYSIRLHSGWLEFVETF